jgi:hypothetical protein
VRPFLAFVCLGSELAHFTFNELQGPDDATMVILDEIADEL